MDSRNPVRMAAEAARGRVLVSRGAALYHAPGSGEQIRLAASDVPLLEAWLGVAPRGLGADLARLRHREITDSELALLTRGIKQLELRAARSAWLAYDKSIRQRAALALREGRGGGALLACWMTMEHADEKGERR